MRWHPIKPDPGRPRFRLGRVKIPPLPFPALTETRDIPITVYRGPSRRFLFPALSQDIAYKLVIAILKAKSAFRYVSCGLKIAI